MLKNIMYFRKKIEKKEYLRFLHSYRVNAAEVERA